MSIEAIKQALKALEYPLITSHEAFDVDIAELLSHRAIESLRQEIAGAEKQEHGESAMKWDASAPLVMTPHPAFAKRQWVGLTDAEFDFLVPYCGNEFDLKDYKDFAKAIEAKLKEKNT